ncbi:FAD-binding oxidoreductase [Lentzea sp. NEAU-D13]|uniref:FAD-binding oxidoreductase n=1 Tax=Lentzea alba TaxID=2714351 RepID=A0A7C9W0A7_9PSEU|nr:FAD-binding oxidoreductase [Lentzea alba]NGY63161.1 FAD-binding oxidoreductase [Lentzea alba]
MIRRRSLLVASATTAAALTTGGWSRGPDWEALRRSLAGDVVLPGDQDYDVVRSLPLKQFDHVRPRGLVLCETPEDVVESLRFARRYGLHAVPRSGGHSFGGYSTTPGVVIDVSRLNEVALRGGVASVGAGAQLVDVHDKLSAHNTSVATGWCPTVGMGGLTLGGGLGLETRKYGVTSDRLRAAEIVLASGERLWCDQGNHRDLFWALRGGGGGNFGIVTKFEFDPVPAAETTSYTLTWPWRAAAAVFDAWQRWAPFAPDELSAVLSFTTNDAAPGTEHTVVVTGSWLGAAHEVEELLSTLVARVGVSPATHSLVTLPHRQSMMRWFGCENLTVQQCHREGPWPGGTIPRYAFAAARGNFFSRLLPDHAIRRVLAAVDAQRVRGHSRSMDIQALGGACNRVSPHATAFLHRDSLFYAGFSVVIDPNVTEEGRRAAYSWADAAWRTARPYANGHVYQNYIDSRLHNWQHAYYGTNYPRLSAVKRRYDPSGFFRFAQSIR